MSFQTYTIKTVNSHVEIYDGNRFVESADNYDEAMQDIQEGDV